MNADEYFFKPLEIADAIVDVIFDAIFAVVGFF
jgi:hypothetical protein